MYELSNRQIQILRYIVKEYIDTAEAVGSETLEKKYDLGVSPATIRNEMAEMVKLGFLSKPHSSAGRIPTSKAIKFYINELMKEKELSVAEEVEAKERVWDLREREALFLRAATKNLAQKTHTLAVATTSEGDIYFAGYSHILDMPEFYDIDITKNLLNILDDVSYFETIFDKIDSNYAVLFGEDMGSDMLRPYSFVFAKYVTHKDTVGTIGVIGPARLRYDYVVPCVRYFGNLVGEVANW